MKVILFPVAAMSLALILVGCITSRSSDCPGYTLQLPKGKVKKSIAYSFLRSENVATDKAYDPSSSHPAFSGAWVAAQPEAIAIAQYRGVFDPVATTITPTADRTGGECDIMLSIHQQNAYNPLVVFPAFLHGFTLGCLPCWGDDVYYLNVTAVDKAGTRKEYLIRREVSTVSWLPFIFAMPFCELPGTAREKITMENWKELRCKLESDGFFDEVKGVKIDATPSENNRSADESAKKFAELKKLKEQGVLTDEEYNNAVERIK